MATIYITPRQAELLSYLTGRGPVGEWVHVPIEWFREDLGFGHRTAVTHLMRKLVEKDCVQSFGFGLYRVLRRVEDPNVEIRALYRPSKRKPTQRSKSRYSGFDPYQAAQFR